MSGKVVPRSTDCGRMRMPAKIHCAQHQLSLEHTAGSRLSYAQPVDAMKIEWKKSAVTPTRNSAAA